MSKNQPNKNNEGDGRIRRRFRGITGSKTGKAVGYTSLATPVIGFIINDLRKPNSLVRQLVSKAVNKLLELKNRKVEALDITDKVEILSESNHDKQIMVEQRKEN